MKNLFQDKPPMIPKNCPDGRPLKSLPQALLDRRATAHFKSDPVPEKILETILRFAAQAPSGYNLQPARFLVVREKENRERLKKAAMDQEKIAEAPAVIIAFAIKDDWKNYLDAIFDEGLRRGVGKAETVADVKKNARDFLENGISAPVWLNRQTMIAFTSLMLMAEVCGLDTAPMEGFDPAAVRREFGLPENSEVIALLALGFAKEPDKAYGGRLALDEIVHDERFGRPWKKSADASSEEIFEEIERKKTETLA